MHHQLVLLSDQLVQPDKSGKIQVSLLPRYQFDHPVLIWFTILIAICLQTSFLTPPVGFSIFYLKGVCPPSVSLKDIYKGIIPFVLLQLIGLAVVIIWPSLGPWLPAIAYGAK